MECKICNVKCILPTSSHTGSSQNIQIQNKDGTIICSACFDVQEFACNISESKPKTNTTNTTNTTTIPTKLSQDSKAPTKNIDNKVYYNCIKCSKSFTGSTCECGFKNPLYRRR